MLQLFACLPILKINYLKNLILNINFWYKIGNDLSLEAYTF